MTTPDDLVQVDVDEKVCVGIGACVVSEPEAFAFEDAGHSRAVTGALLPRSRAERVCDLCPSGAISIRSTDS